MSPAAATDKKQWQIVLEPSCKCEDMGTIVVCYMSEVADKQDAITDAEGYAELIELHGGVDRWALGVECHITGGVIRRAGKSSWRVRLDCWEHETASGGYHEGYGYLRVKELFVIQPEETA